MDRNRPIGNLKTVSGKLLSMVGDTTGNTEAHVKGRAAVIAGRSQNAYGQARDYAQDIGDDAVSLAEEGYERTRDYVETQVTRLEDQIRENPAAAALIAGGIGLLIGFLLPSKR